jgi:hypothetical protein
MLEYSFLQQHEYLVKMTSILLMTTKNLANKKLSMIAMLNL